MKQWIKVLIWLAIVGVQTVSAQYQMILQHALQPSSKVFQFDVYIVSTGADFTLTSYSIKLSCGSAISNGGTLSISYVPASTALSFGVLGTMAGVSGGVTTLTIASDAGSQTVSTTPLKVGTFQIANTVDFGATPAAMTWDFSAPFPTIVNINNDVATVPSGHINALSPYRIVAQNDVLVNDHTYEFDVDIVRTVADFTLSSYQICFTFNNAAANGGTLSFSYVPGTTALSACTPLTPGVVVDGGTTNLICGSTAGSQAVSGLQLRIGRFRVTNTVPFGSATMNLEWDFAGNFFSQININHSNVTLPANHFKFLDNSPLPVELVSFTGRNANNEVLLNWKTASEQNNYGFDVQRKAGAGQWEKIGFLSGQGTSNAPKEYSYADKASIAGTVQYRLRQIDLSGKSKLYAPIEVAVAAPVSFRLMQNSPNPFNPSTSITYQLPVSAFVTLKVYDMLGREVVTLADGTQPAGSYKVEWNGRDAHGASVTSGVYLYRLSTGQFTETRKMNYVR